MFRSKPVKELLAGKRRRNIHDYDEQYMTQLLYACFSEDEDEINIVPQTASQWRLSHDDHKMSFIYKKSRVERHDRYYWVLCYERSCSTGREIIFFDPEGVFDSNHFDLDDFLKKSLTVLERKQVSFSICCSWFAFSQYETGHEYAATGALCVALAHHLLSLLQRKEEFLTTLVATNSVEHQKHARPVFEQYHVSPAKIIYFDVRPAQLKAGTALRDLYCRSGEPPLLMPAARDSAILRILAEHCAKAAFPPSHVVKRKHDDECEEEIDETSASQDLTETPPVIDANLRSSSSAMLPESHLTEVVHAAVQAALQPVLEKLEKMEQTMIRLQRTVDAANTSSAFSSIKKPPGKPPMTPPTTTGPRGKPALPSAPQPPTLNASSKDLSRLEAITREWLQAESARGIDHVVDEWLEDEVEDEQTLRL